MLNKEELLGLGYEINEDPDQPGMFYWKTKIEASVTSFYSEEEAVFSASDHAWRVHDELRRCDNCGKVHTDETLKIAKHLGERVDPGGVMPSGECNECGALCYPIKPDPDWEAVMSYFGLDPSFMYTAKHVMDYTRQCIESMAEADRKERMGEAAIAALAQIKAHPNCRHEVEAQLGEDIWTALQGSGGKQVGDASQKAMKLLEEADSYLREIRAENLDGSEPALGELLERLTGFWVEAEPKAPTSQGVFKYLDCSTSHISKQTMELLDQGEESGLSFMSVAPYKYGAFVTVPDDTAECVRAMPNDLAEVLAFAHSCGCQLVRFDSDGVTYDELPSFNW
jgi:hypothetical protein